MLYFNWKYHHTQLYSKHSKLKKAHKNLIQKQSYLLVYKTVTLGCTFLPLKFL